jgi:hypothetical protein
VEFTKRDFAIAVLRREIGCQRANPRGPGAAVTPSNAES